jgi:hypothetical protein
LSKVFIWYQFPIVLSPLTNLLTHVAFFKQNEDYLKIMIIKFALVISIFTFVASACVVPDKYRKGIERKCFKFIWDGKPDKYKILKF